MLINQTFYRKNIALVFLLLDYLLQFIALNIFLFYRAKLLAVTFNYLIWFGTIKTTKEIM